MKKTNKVKGSCLGRSNGNSQREFGCCSVLSTWTLTRTETAAVEASSWRKEGQQQRNRERETLNIETQQERREEGSRGDEGRWKHMKEGGECFLAPFTHRIWQISYTVSQTTICQFAYRNCSHLSCCVWCRSTCNLTVNGQNSSTVWFICSTQDNAAQNVFCLWVVKCWSDKWRHECALRYWDGTFYGPNFKKMIE